MERNKNSSTLPTEDLLRTREWSGYLDYLRVWVDEHATPLSWGMSPTSFGEWCCNGAQEKRCRNGEEEEDLI